MKFVLTVGAAAILLSFFATWQFPSSTLLTHPILTYEAIHRYPMGATVLPVSDEERRLLVPQGHTATVIGYEVVMLTKGPLLLVHVRTSGTLCGPLPLGTNPEWVIPAEQLRRSGQAFASR